MLKRVDRVQIAVRDNAIGERVVAEVFGGELLRRDNLSILHAKRSTMQAGSSLIELLEPDGAGPIAEFVAKFDGGLYGAGFSVEDLDTAARHLDANGVRFERASGELYLDPRATFGINAVLSAHHDRNPVGTIKWIYEVTNVVGDWRAASDRYAKIFNLDASKFSPITSPEFGYTGTLTLFNPPERLDRIEISQITDYEKAMGRFIASAAIPSTCFSSRPMTSIRSRNGSRREDRNSPRVRATRPACPSCSFIRPPSMAC
jgi:hypothetical protein